MEPSSVRRAGPGNGAHRCPRGVETTLRTRACAVAMRAGNRDAANVVLASLLVPSALRRCPLCGADAVAAVARTDPGRRARFEVRCGGCATWRAIEGRRRRIAALERRLDALVRHDRRRMALAFARDAATGSPMAFPPLRAHR
jgi:hypothetical protein